MDPGGGLEAGKFETLTKKQSGVDLALVSDVVKILRVIK